LFTLLFDSSLITASLKFREAVINDVIKIHSSLPFMTFVVVYDNEFLWECAQDWKSMETQRDVRVLDRFGPPEG
jgi:hypothetical protein